MYELNPNEFLYLFYSRLNTKLIRILELTKQKIKTTSEVKELFETKSKIITALDMLSIESNETELKEGYTTLAKLITSTNENDIQLAINFCMDTRI